MLHIVSQSLTPDVFCSMRDKASFLPYTPEDAAMALKNSLYTVEIRDDNKTVGMARLIGDNRLTFFIKDVVVDPAYQKQGIGQMLMQALLAYIRLHACDNAYIGLMATPGTEEFYEKFGFIRRPTATLGHGMVQFLKSGR